MCKLFTAACVLTCSEVEIYFGRFQMLSKQQNKKPYSHHVATRSVYGHSYHATLNKNNSFNKSAYFTIQPAANTSSNVNWKLPLLLLLPHRKLLGEIILFTKIELVLKILLCYEIFRTWNEPVPEKARLVSIIKWFWLSYLKRFNF